MYPQGVCRIRKPAYAGNGCAIFLVFQAEEVGQKDGCGSQTQLRGVALWLLANVGQDAAVHVQHMTIDEVGGIGCQEDRGADQVLRGAPASGGRLADDEFIKVIKVIETKIQELRIVLAK